MTVLYRFGTYEMDITTYTMLLLCKMQALAFCYKDGGADEKTLSAD
jgi:hypothetical protein